MIFIPVLSYSSGYTGIRITNASPINIKCGSSTTITVEISYYRDASDASAHSLNLSFYQVHSWWFDDLLGNISVDMPAAAGNGKFTVDYTLNCDIQQSGKCKFFGPWDSGSGQSPHTIYAQLGTMESVKVQVNCEKPDGTYCYLVPPDNPINQGSTATVALAVNCPVRPVKEIDMLVTDDANNFSLANAAFTTAFLANCSLSSIDKTTPGKIRFMATLKTPKVISGQSAIASLSLQAHNNTPYGPYLINIESASGLWDASHQSIDAQLGEQSLVIAPVDKDPPLINNSLVSICENAVRGRAGAISDNFLSMNGYIKVSLYKDEKYYQGGATVHADGSFLIDGMHIQNGDNLKLIAGNYAGKNTIYTFSANPGSDPNACDENLTFTENTGKTISGMVVSDEDIKKTTFNTPNGNVVLYTTDDQEWLQSGKSLTGTVSLQPAGKTQQEKQNNLNELKKCLLMVGSTAVAISEAEQLIHYTGKKDPTANFQVSLTHPNGQDKSAVNWAIPRNPVTEYSGQAQPGPSLLMDQKLTAGNNMVVVHTLPVTGDEFGETDHFTMTDSKGSAFPVYPVSQSPTTTVLKIPDEASKGNITISRTRDNHEKGKVSFYYYDFSFTSPDTKLTNGQNSVVRTEIMHGDNDETQRPPFQMVIRNLDPRVISLQGGELQIVKFPLDGAAGNNSWILNSRVTGRSQGSFSLNATLSQDYFSRTDAFTPQMEALNDPEQFNHWTDALKRDLIVSTNNLDNSPSAQTMKANTMRAVNDLPHCTNAASLPDCKKLVSQLLQPLQVPQNTVNAWSCTYEAMKSAGSKLNDLLTGKETLVNWPVLQKGLELISQMGNKWKDKQIVDDALTLISQIPGQGSNGKLDAASFNSNLQSLVQRCNQKYDRMNRGFRY